MLRDGSHFGHVSSASRMCYWFSRAARTRSSPRHGRMAAVELTPAQFHLVLNIGRYTSVVLGLRLWVQQLGISLHLPMISC